MLSDRALDNFYMRNNDVFADAVFSFWNKANLCLLLKKHFDKNVAFKFALNLKAS